MKPGSVSAARTRRPFPASLIPLLSLLILLAAYAPARAAGEFRLDALQDSLGKLPFPSLASGKFDNVPVNIEADRLQYDDDSGVAEAEGNVQVSFGDHVFKARRIRYDGTTGEALLDGDVKFDGPEGSFSFERVLISVPDGTGYFDNGVIDLGSGNYRITSDRFHKTGEKTFTIREGSFTTCPCDPIPDWSLGARSLKVTIDGYAVGRDVIFRIRGYPVLWLPWGLFPAKVTRQSGILLPVVGQSGSKGLTMSLPLYWAVNRWSDATLTVEGMTRRGVRPEAEYRVMLKDDSEATVRGSWFNDRVTGQELWRAWGEGFMRYSDRFSLSARWDTASGGEYYRDFSDVELERKSRHIVSRGYVEDKGGNDVLSVSFDLAKESQLPRLAGETPRRLPELGDRLLPVNLPLGVDLRGEMAAAHLTRSTTVDNSGVTAESRARGFLEFSRPTRLGPYVSATPFMFLDFLASRPEGTDNAAARPWRAVPGAGIQLSTSLFRETLRPAGHRYVHTVRPSLAFRWTPAVAQDDIPLTDDWSRVAERSRFTVNLTQSLHRLEREEKDPRELATLDVEWTYDLGDRNGAATPYLDPLSSFSVAFRDQIDAIAGRDRRERNASDVLVQGRFHPYAEHRLQGELLYDPVETSLTHASAGYEYGGKGRNRALVEYRVARGLTEEVKGLLSWRVISFLRLGAEAAYSLRNDSLKEGKGQVLFLPRSECWTLGLVVKRTSLPKDTAVKVVFSLLGLGGTSEVD